MSLTSCRQVGLVYDKIVKLMQFFYPMELGEFVMRLMLDFLSTEEAELLAQFAASVGEDAFEVWIEQLAKDCGVVELLPLPPHKLHPLKPVSPVFNDKVFS
jgi:hypothetical protein